ncbi:MAG: hypothetical protein CMJ85_02935 [Planctomycetes bacterium]|jgi:hypothetical protein|nr:hypothetical protein [Planctomycetota bacterium]MDP6423837.1 hypothetical protein [Planctomycetota bacterium]
MRRFLRIAIPILVLIGLVAGAMAWQEGLTGSTEAATRDPNKRDVLELEVGGKAPRLQVEGTR